MKSLETQSTITKLTAEEEADLIQLTLENLLRGYTDIETAESAINSASGSNNRFEAIQGAEAIEFSHSSIVLDGIAVYGHRGIVGHVPVILGKHNDIDSHIGVLKLELDEASGPKFQIQAIGSAALH